VNREWGFYTLVEHWFQGYGYSYATELGCPSAYRSPGFLFFLTALYSVIRPENTLAQALIQNLIAWLALILVYVVGKRFVGKKAALLGGLMMACYPYTFYHFTQYYHTFLSTFFILFLVWTLLRLKENKKLSTAVLAGVSIGALWLIFRARFCRRLRLLSFGFCGCGGRIGSEQCLSRQSLWLLFQRA
jgi:4-amino-4-deoxy-L-arabinose transferase-like glycosyltransferase